MTTAPAKMLPPRSEVPAADTWDLSQLYASEEAWEADFAKLQELIPGFAPFRGRLGESAAVLLELLVFDSQVDRLAERLGSYAFLKTTEDQANSESQRRVGRYQNLASKASEAASFIQPELMAIPDDQMQALLADETLKDFRLALERSLRYKKYTLSEPEEKLLAMQGEMASAIGKAFRQLVDADLKFGLIENEKGETVELGSANLIQLLRSPQRAVRKKAFEQYYEQFEGHENTLAATLSGSIQKDVYYAKVRGYDSALQGALYSDNVPQSVYDNLIAGVRDALPDVHRFYDLRRRKMKLDDIHHYDTYVPILSDIDVRHTWEEGVETILAALAPLGESYCQTLAEGLRGRWCDRYPNKGKQSGAFSAGSYDGQPYILMNYKPDVLNDVFTLAHEAGHSMHSYYSVANQPFHYYQYSIFVAEVASTFNEELLSAHLLKNAEDPSLRAYLINNEIDDIRSTIVRQTMFAEFEKITHEMAEAGEPLTVDAFKEVYGKLLNDYFGDAFNVDPQLRLECFRIPHFYRAFYVYKYATGMSAAIALARGVLTGGESELTAYLNFLKTGCSKFPLDLLADAGVDLREKTPVETALKRFGKLVDELDELLD
ncbi:oligoendopeptidase F [Lignipirellula cremea]|uniref:Oligopeptidase F n=1 Tax=Lignipirellula cremea TaxID=2528010 RepID=A0A518DMB2_9BACT|nr:oligoendopeptidase F [Lignipirellula cremea]QDU92974.1 Oligoendopeptidase F, plasmid [Lignipirellula cremea]